MQWDEFQCAGCGGVFVKADPTGAEPTKEFESYWGKSFPKENLVSLCEDCYERWHPTKYQREIENEVARTLKGANHESDLR